MVWRTRDRSQPERALGNPSSCSTRCAVLLSAHAMCPTQYATCSATCPNTPASASACKTAS